MYEEVHEDFEPERNEVMPSAVVFKQLLNEMSWWRTVSAAVLLLTSLGAADATERYPGRRVDVGGYRLYLHCLGIGHPVVVLDAGLGRSSQDWSRVQAELANTAQTCIYDRAGYGQSDPGPPPRTSSRIASELRTLLTRVALPSPYVLVGHSFGGYNMRLFASLYPKDTAGLVLVDAPHEGQMDSLLQSQIMRLIDPQGVLPRIWRPEILSDLPVDLAPIARLLGLEVKTFRTIVGELAAFKESGAELQATTLLPEVPLVVIIHGRSVLPEGTLGDQVEQQWLNLQRELAARSKHGTVIIAKDSAHNIPFEQPELIIQAVRRIVKTQPRDTGEQLTLPSHPISRTDL